MVKICEIPINIDLALFSRWLSSQRVPHRISEENGVQVLWLLDDSAGPSVQTALNRYLQDDEFKKQLDTYSAQLKISFPSPQSGLPRPTVLQAPLTVSFILVALAIALITNFGEGGPILRAMMIVDPLGVDTSTFAMKLEVLLATLSEYQLWRLFTPDFVHFGVMHLVFNMLMLWFLGGQIEYHHGRGRFVTLFVVCSVVPNTAQYLESGPLFGGMSGVVYGLVGYCWLWSRSRPGALVFPPALMGVSVIWLLIGFTPLTEILLIGKMANSAHLFGLLMGLLIATVALLRSSESFRE